MKIGVSMKEIYMIKADQPQVMHQPSKINLKHKLVGPESLQSGSVEITKSLKVVTANPLILGELVTKFEVFSISAQHAG